MEEPKRLLILRDVKELLIRNSGVRCAFHKCNKLIIDDNNRLKGEICHIEAAMPGGERFNAQMTNEERRSINNLILLCFDHHEETNNEAIYSVNVLQNMKKVHESNVFESLSLMESITEVSNIDNVPKVNAERVIKAMDLLKRHEQFLELEKNSYQEPLNYIKRSIYYLNDKSEGIWERNENDLLEIVRQKRRITLLGVAGSGKSIELEYLAFYYSKENNEFFPVKIRLNNFNKKDGIEDLLELEFPDYRLYKDQKLLILLDALDEVAPDNLGEAVRQIETLPKKLPQSTIVVSCRNNFYTVETTYQNSRIKDFNTYALNPLTEYDIDKYCEVQLGERKLDFLEGINKKKLTDQLKSPFYLVSLIEYFIKYKSLPKSRIEIFEFLLSHRIDKDKKDKYDNHGLNIDEHQVIINERIQKLAVAAEYLQRNFLEDVEFRTIIPESNLQILIKHTFLFDKNKNGSWEFHHNNFQEYLAAKYLSHLTFNQIKQFISFSPDFKKVKPSWVNTLSFLLDILSATERKFKRLLNWLISHEIDLLIHFEKDNINIKTRENIFKRIYKDFEKKKILIRSEKFNLVEFADFITDSHFIAKFLIKKAKVIKEDWKKSEAIRILADMDVIKTYNIEFKSLLITLISDKKIKNNYKLSFFYALSDLSIYSIELTEKLLKIIDIESSQYLRAGFYSYLINAENGDLYSELIINGIRFIKEPEVSINGTFDKPLEPEEIRLSAEEFNLVRLIEKFNTIQLTKELLNWGHTIDESRYDSFHIKIMEKVLKNAITLTPQYPELYNEVLTLLISLAKKYSRELSNEFNDYFAKTNTTLQAFRELRKQMEIQSQIDFQFAIAAISNDSCIDVLLMEYSKGELSYDDAIKFQNILGRERAELRKYFIDELNKLSNNAFIFSTRDFNKERNDKLKNDVKLILDKGKFETEISQIFDQAGVDSFEYNELWEFSKPYLNDDKTRNNIVLATIRQQAKSDGIVARNSIYNFLKDKEKWKWFQINKLLEIDTNNVNFEFDENIRAFLINWLNDALKISNFQTATYLNEFDQIRHRYLEHFIPYISYRLNYCLETNVYLDFLWLSPKIIPQKSNNNNFIISSDEEVKSIPSNLNKYVIDNTSIKETRDKIVKNINSNALISKFK